MAKAIVDRSGVVWGGSRGFAVPRRPCPPLMPPCAPWRARSIIALRVPAFFNGKGDTTKTTGAPRPRPSRPAPSTLALAFAKFHQSREPVAPFAAHGGLSCAAPPSSGQRGRRGPRRFCASSGVVRLGRDILRRGQRRAALRRPLARRISSRFPMGGCGIVTGPTLSLSSAYYYGRDRRPRASGGKGRAGRRAELAAFTTARAPKSGRAHGSRRPFPRETVHGTAHGGFRRSCSGGCGAP